MVRKTVAIAVPQKYFFSVNVFLEDAGIVNVQIPHGLRFGDEFEYEYEPSDTPRQFKVLELPLPFDVKPGHTFRHRVPNGKVVTVMCPPKAQDGDILLIPWSDSSNPHSLIQAQVAPPKPVQEQTKPPSNPKPKPKPRFSVDDIQLARALSLTTLDSTPDFDLNKAIEASLLESSSRRVNEDDYVKRAVKESLVEAERQHQRLLQVHDHSQRTGLPPVPQDLNGSYLRQTNLASETDPVIAARQQETQPYSKLQDIRFDTQSSRKPDFENTMDGTKTIQPPPRLLFSARSDEMDEEEMVRKVMELSAVDTYHNQPTPTGPKSPPADDDDEILRKALELSAKEAESASTNGLGQQRDDEDDDLLRKALELSAREAEEHNRRLKW